MSDSSNNGGVRPSTRWHRVATSYSGDDEFSTFSVDAPQKDDPVKLDVDGKPVEKKQKEGFWAGAFRWIFR